MCKPKDAPKEEFHKCCGQCPAARKAAKEGGPVEPHEPCHLKKSKPETEQKPDAPKP